MNHKFAFKAPPKYLAETLRNFLFSFNIQVSFDTTIHFTLFQGKWPTSGAKSTYKMHTYKVKIYI